MVKEVIVRICVIVCTTVLLCSCVEDIDFDQTKEFEITPVLESSLIFFDESANRFLDIGNEIITIQDFVIVDLFDDKFVVDNLIKAEFKFESVNTINRAFELQVDLYDATQLQHTFTVFQEASSNNNENSTTYIENFEYNTLAALKRTKVLVFTLRILSGPPINQDTLGRIQLKSLVAFYFKIGDSL